MESELKSIDSQHYRWAMTCPTCQIEFGGVIKRKGWLQFDPVCLGCQHTIAGFTNPQWPPAPGFLERLLAVIMLRCCRVLDFINATLRWALTMIDSRDEEIECSR